VKTRATCPNCGHEFEADVVLTDNYDLRPESTTTGHELIIEKRATGVDGTEGCTAVSPQ
jgi:transposase